MIDWAQVLVAFIFIAGLLFCGAMIAFAAVQLVLSAWEWWREWYRARRGPKF